MKQTIRKGVLRKHRGVSRTNSLPKVELSMALACSFQLLTNATKKSTLDNSRPHVLKFVQVLKLSKVVGAKSAGLQKLTISQVYLNIE